MAIVTELDATKIKDSTPLTTSVGNTIVVTIPQATILEARGTLFNSGSAVFLPIRTGEGDVTGIDIIKLVFEYLKNNKDKYLLIAGHTTSSGSSQANMEISGLRGQSALFLLIPNGKDKWVEICKKKHTIKDYQAILTFYNGKFGLECDPQGINGSHNSNTAHAIIGFKQGYNKLVNDVLKGRKLFDNLDGTMTDDTWGAFYEIYLYDLTQRMGINTPAELENAQQEIRFLKADDRVLACGESVPIASLNDNRSSNDNKRVEFAFLDKPTWENCPVSIYHRMVKRSYLNPQNSILTPGSFLRISKMDVFFAPEIETLTLEYSIGGLSDKKAIMKITSKKYGNSPVYEYTLTDPEKGDGNNKQLTTPYSGATTCKTGQLKDMPLCAAFSPYKIAFYTETGKEFDSREVKVMVHSLELSLGDFSRGIFDNPIAPTNPANPIPVKTKNKGIQERLKSLGYYHGAIDGDLGNLSKKAIEWFQSEHDLGAPVKGDFGNSTEIALVNRLPFCIDGGVLPAPAASAKIFLSGAFFFTSDNQLGGNTNFRFKAERAFWGDGLKIPVIAKIYIAKKDNTKVFAPKAVGPLKVFFEWTDVAENIAVLTDPMPQDYISAAVDYDKTKTKPQGDNCHADRGGKRGADRTKTLVVNPNPSSFPFKKQKAQHRGACVISTASLVNPDQGFAGIIFRPSRMGGDAYTLRAYLHNDKDLDAAAEVNTVPDIPVAETGTMTVWRRIRINQALRKPHGADVGPLNMGGANPELAKAYLEFTGNLASRDITLAEWNANSNNALSHDPKFAQIGRIDFGSLNVIDFQPFAIGGALTPAQYNNLCTGKVELWMGLLGKEFAKNQFHGMTILRVGWGNDSFYDRSGIAFPGGIAYVAWPDATYVANAISVLQYAVHEPGHCLYLRHHYANTAAGAGVAIVGAHPPATSNSDFPYNHDVDDTQCVMGYQNPPWHFCGKCILKLRGWDEEQLDPLDANNRKI